MSKLTSEDDRSQAGYLVHSAQNSGRGVRLVVYIEGISVPRYTVESHIVCRTAEQAAELARVLREAKFSQP